MEAAKVAPTSVLIDLGCALLSCLPRQNAAVITGCCGDTLQPNKTAITVSQVADLSVRLDATRPRHYLSACCCDGS